MLESQQIKLSLPSLDTTRKLGQFIGQIVQPDTILTLSGEIGSGKTTLVKAIAQGLAVEETVTSPTFIMMNEYHSGRLPLYHFDLYRLIDRTDMPFHFIAAQLEEILNAESLVIIEWAEIFSRQYGKEMDALFKNGILSLNIQTHPDDMQRRTLTLTLLDQKKQTASYMFGKLCKFSKDISITK